MNFAWKVKIVRYNRHGCQIDHYEYNAVIAANIKQACQRGLKQAINDSGIKSKWSVTNAERGEWVVS